MNESNAGLMSLPVSLTSPVSLWHGRIIQFGGTLAAAALGYWFGGSWPFAVITAVSGFVLVGIYLRWSQTRQTRQFAVMLPDLLLSLANSLKVGHSLSQAIEHVAVRQKGLTGAELRIVSDRINLGDRPQQAMENLARRFPCDEIEYTLLALSIHDTAGGDLAKTLESSASSISDTLSMRAEVAANTAQARISSYFIACLPIFLVLFLNFIIPTYYAALLNVWLGDAVFAAIFGLVLTAFVIVRQIQDSVENV